MIDVDDHGHTLVVIGEGDVAICTARTPENKCDNELVLIQGTKHEVGTQTDAFVGKATSDLPKLVRVQILSRSALDVLIDQLNVLKSQWR